MSKEDTALFLYGIKHLLPSANRIWRPENIDTFLKLLRPNYTVTTKPQLSILPNDH